MRTVQDVEAYLGRMNRKYEPVDGNPSAFLVEGGPGMPTIALWVDAPLVVLRVHVGDIEGDATTNAPLYEKLLTLNAKALVHTSFGLESGKIVLSSAHELENLDYNELTAALDEIDVTLAQQVPQLAELSRAVKSARPQDLANARAGTKGNA